MPQIRANKKLNHPLPNNFSEELQIWKCDNIFVHNFLSLHIELVL
jgi:hypothetical protein